MENLYNVFTNKPVNIKTIKKKYVLTKQNSKQNHGQQFSSPQTIYKISLISES